MKVLKQVIKTLLLVSILVLIPNINSKAAPTDEQMNIWYHSENPMRDIDEVVESMSNNADDYIPYYINAELVEILKSYKNESCSIEDLKNRLYDNFVEVCPGYVASELEAEEVDDAIFMYFIPNSNYDNNCRNIIAQNYGITTFQLTQALELNYANTSIARELEIESFDQLLELIDAMLADMGYANHIRSNLINSIQAEINLSNTVTEDADMIAGQVDPDGSLNLEIIDFFFDPELSIMCEAYSLADDAINGTTYRILSCWQEAADLIAVYVLQDYGPDLTNFYSYFGIDTTRNWLVRGRNYDSYGYVTTEDSFIMFFKIAGYIAATLIFLWNLFCLLFGPLTSQRETPLKLIARYGLTIFIIFIAQDIVGILCVIAKALWNYASAIEFGDYSLLSGYFAPWDLVSNIPCSGLLRIIISIALGWQIVKGFMKLFIEIVERYVLFGILSVIFPFASSTNVSSTTSSIFKAYLQMFISQMIILVMNLWFIRMFFRLLAYRTTDNTDWAASIIFFMFAITYLRVARRLDEYMLEMGLSVGLTGTNLVNTIISAVQTSLSIGSSAIMASNKAMTTSGKSAMSMGVKTGNPGMYAAGSAITSLGNVLSGKNGNSGNAANGDSNAKILAMQATSGRRITVPYNNNMWRSGANATLTNSSALSSESIQGALNTYMSPQFRASNPSTHGLHCSANGSCITGIASIPLCGGSSKDVSFKLTRDRIPNSIPHKDIMGNTWYQQYQNPKLNPGEAIAVNSPTFEVFTGISPEEISALQMNISDNDDLEAVLSNDGIHITDNHENLVAKKLDDGTWCYNVCDEDTDELLEIVSENDFGKSQEARYRLDIQDKSEDEHCWLEQDNDHLILNGWDSKGEEVKYYLYDLSRDDVDANRFPKSRRLISTDPNYPSFGYIKHKAR